MSIEHTCMSAIADIIDAETYFEQLAKAQTAAASADADSQKPRYNGGLIIA